MGIWYNIFEFFPVRKGRISLFDPNPDRYQKLPMRRAGESGLILSALSLGCWHNFGFEKPYEDVRKMILRAFDQGIYHFDFANNYGRPAGSAESHFGRILKEDLHPYRNQLVISTKAGYYMWEGPFGEWGSRKYLLASLDQSLMRLGIDYVDIFYSHRYDPNTPLRETMTALSDAVHQGKALYTGLSNYPKEALKEAISILKDNKTPPVLIQPHFSLMDQEFKLDGSLELSQQAGVGVIPFSIFNQGLLTGKYLNGIPKDSRMGDPNEPYFHKNVLSESLQKKLRDFDNYAQSIGRSMTECALLYPLHLPGITSILLGVSRLSQLEELLEIATKPPLSKDVIQNLNQLLTVKGDV
ncbi:MAG: L-glyceraldehyde 3-phosphate reductase [Acholeplasmataceae bacterium]|nr:L-glyceraldehyde 3-phosphate reductase [Acholeplasmataceae bacterium]